MLTLPSTDLACLISTSTLPSFRKPRLPAWLRTYHMELGRVLREVLGSKEDLEEVYPLERLEADYRARYGHGFYWGIMNAQVRIRMKRCSMMGYSIR